MTEQVRALLEMSRAVPRPVLLNDRRASATRSRKVKNGKRHTPDLELPVEHGQEAVIFRGVPSPSNRIDSRGIQPASLVTSASPPPSRARSAPVSEVSVSGGEAKQEGTTRIFVAPHLVPSSPNRREASDDAVNLTVGASLTPDVSFADVPPPHGSVPIQRVVSYDAEENCLISETGVDSQHAKIHYPLSWAKAGIEPVHGSGSPSRDIVVTRPFRHKGTGALSVVSQPESGASNNAWGSETVNFSTGNKERDDVMSRAKAILETHGETSSDPLNLHTASSWGEDEDGEDAELNDSRDANIVQSLSDSLCQEDGIAPLGGTWPEPPASRKYTRQLLIDPMNNLPLIHEEASRRLSVRFRSNFGSALLIVAGPRLISCFFLSRRTATPSTHSPCSKPSWSARGVGTASSTPTWRRPCTTSASCTFARRTTGRPSRRSRRRPGSGRDRWGGSTRKWPYVSDSRRLVGGVLFLV